MINEKPNIVFGDGNLPRGEEFRRGKGRSLFGTEQNPAKDFASFLSSEKNSPLLVSPKSSAGKPSPKTPPAFSAPAGSRSGMFPLQGQFPAPPIAPPVTTADKATPATDGSGDKTVRTAMPPLSTHSTGAAAPTPTLLAASDNLALTQAMQANAERGARSGRKRVSTISGRPAFGMEDTRPTARNRMSMHTAESPANLDKKTLARVLQESPAPLKTLNSMPASMRQTGATPTVIAFEEEKYPHLLLDKSGGNSALRLDSALLSGDSTKALLQAFKDLGPVNKHLLALNPQLAPQKTGKVKKLPENGVTKAMFAETAIASARASKGAGQPGNLGTLAAKFESGDMGIAAIGYDQHGGTSYGKFQISSRVGTMKKFIGYLEENAPDIAQKLASAGPANTGSRSGRMPNVWRQIATNEPERFETLQNDFIKSSHYEPAINAIAETTGISPSDLPSALQEVVFSTAVQHGPNGAANIISRAVTQVGANKLTATPSQTANAASGTNQMVAEQELIRQIYSLRSRQFGSSSSQVRSAVQNRLKHEMHDALALLREETQTVATAQASDLANRRRPIV